MPTPNHISSIDDLSDAEVLSIKRQLDQRGVQSAEDFESKIGLCTERIITADLHTLFDNIRDRAIDLIAS